MLKMLNVCKSIFIGQLYFICSHRLYCIHKNANKKLKEETKIMLKNLLLVSGLGLCLFGVSFGQRGDSGAEARADRASARAEAQAARAEARAEQNQAAERVRISVERFKNADQDAKRVDPDSINADKAYINRADAKSEMIKASNDNNRAIEKVIATENRRPQ
jgi:hypothetical protein